MRQLPKSLIVFLAVLAIPSIVSLFFFSIIGIAMFTSEPLTIPVAWLMGANVTGAFKSFSSPLHWAIIMAGPLGIYALAQLLVICWTRVTRPDVNWRKFRSRYLRGAITGVPLLLIMLFTSFFDDFIHPSPVA